MSLEALTTEIESTRDTLACLLTAAWLLPLLGFMVEIFGGYWGKSYGGVKCKIAAYMTVFCIASGFVCSTA